MNLHSIKFSDYLSDKKLKITQNTIDMLVKETDKMEIKKISSGITANISYNTFPKDFQIRYGNDVIKFSGIINKEYREIENGKPIIKRIIFDKKMVKGVNNNIIEGIITMLFSELFTDGISPHFVVCFGFNSRIIFLELCRSKEQYTTIDKWAEYLYTHKLHASTLDIDALFIAILHSLMIAYNKYKLCHVDLHIGNLYLQDFSGDNVYYQGKCGKNIRYFIYELSDGKLYLPNPGYIAKIADFGFSAIRLPVSNYVFISDDEGDMVSSSLDKIYPNYLYGNKDNYHFVNYSIFRNVVRFLGICESKIAEHVLTKIPLFIYEPEQTYIGYHETKYDMISPDEILEMNIFDKYRMRPVDLTDKNSIEIYYK